MYQQTLFKILDNHIKPQAIRQRNKYKKWEYGYDKEYDIIVISRSGKIGEIYLKNVIYLYSIDIRINLKL